MEKLCVVGDLHGRLRSFEHIVNKYRPQGYKFILLGDMIHHKYYFRRTQKSSPIKMMEYLISLKDDVQCILGNNEMYVLNNISAPIEKIHKKEAKFTVDCLRSLNTSRRLNILKWMMNLPDHYELGKYRFAHAFYKDPNSSLFGPGERWFEPENIDKYHLDENYEYFIGHYGRPFFYKNLRVIDCTELEGIGIYLTDKNLFKVYV